MFLRYLRNRVFMLLLVIFMAVTINFIIPRLIPGDPVEQKLATLAATGGGSSNIDEVAEVYRDLLMLKVEKELSFGERKMLDTAGNLLVKEISLAREVEETQVERDLDKIFS